MKKSSLAQAWAMLFALASGFALSNAYRTVAAITAPPLALDMGLSPQQLGTFAGSFHFMFGAMQLFMGIGIDLWGVRRTILVAAPLTIIGAVLSALAPDYGTLVAGQALIGIGCAPAFLAATVFISRYFPVQKFAAVSGMAMAIGVTGMLFTGTPLAWLIEKSSWRMGFWVLAALSVLAWLWVFRSVHEDRLVSNQAVAGGAPRESVREALMRFGALLKMPHTWGIVTLSFVCYAAFITLRGLWLGPMLISRHGFSLVQSGNVALALSLSAMVGPMVFGRLDPGPARRRRWLVACALIFAVLFTVIAFEFGPWCDVLTALAVGFFSGFAILQYADVRSSYPAGITGRAMALFTMAMFLGVAAMQWFTGWVATHAQGWGLEPFGPVMGSIALLLVIAALAFRFLPGPQVEGSPP
ncbi:nitrate/nitrite transporter [Bordetella sp. LUAb4]|uniref:MFS transporter n=1 Tax=Bordetella sp. LUAb4 TaxID=2843195 RepID=UPI001E6487EC|nr:MFS transporter [Bordetella sp. LUAb4]